MAKLAQTVGMDKVADCAQSLGIKSPLKVVPSLALGSSVLTLLELTQAYSAFADQGTSHEPRAVLEVTDHQDEVLEKNDAVHRAVLDPKIAYLVTDVLQEVVLEGTARWIKDWGFTKAAAGKTGTSDNYRDAWFIGYTPNLLCGVWVGDDQEKSLGLSASALAIPVWAQFMKAALAQEDDKPFRRPEGILEFSIDRDTGMLAKSGCLKVGKELFILGTEPREKCTAHSGGMKGFFKKLFENAP